MGLIPRSGTSRGGDPLSFSRTPADDLSRHVARFFITIIDRGADDVLEDFLLHETAYCRVPVEGRWETKVAGRWVSYEGPMLFGAQSRRFPVRCVGPIVAAGFALRPAAWFAFSNRPADRLADRLEPIEGIWGESLRWACSDIHDIEQTFARLADVVRDRLAGQRITIDPRVERFETIARIDPTRAVASIADELALTPRQIDRTMYGHFGHSPKMILRRSRFLDMAAVMRGLAIPGLDADAALRFYDASHLNREFRLFVDMTPAQFQRTPTPLMTPGIEVRQQRKLADMAGLAAMPADAPPPWLAPAPGSIPLAPPLTTGNDTGADHAG